MRKLDHDIQLASRSVWMAGGGHAGSEVVYHAETREVISSTWCVRKDPKSGKPEKSSKEERFPIPPEITTEEDLRQYLLEKHHVLLDH